MRIALLFTAICLAACTAEDKKKPTPSAIETVMPPDNTVVEETETAAPSASDALNAQKEYANMRFRKVKAGKIGEDTYRVTGEGQIFESGFGWVVEDGHNELAKGHAMTDAGAPEWGDFNFEVKAEKARPNSTLHLILFEISPKDGSRQHELHIPLE